MKPRTLPTILATAVLLLLSPPLLAEAEANDAPWHNDCELVVDEPTPWSETCEDQVDEGDCAAWDDCAEHKLAVQECVGNVFPDQDWYQTCNDELDDYDCHDWVACIEDNTEFVQTRSCSPTGGFPSCSSGEQPIPVQWYHEAVDYKINVYGTRDLHNDSEITDEVKHDVFDSFDVWNDVDCSFFEMAYDGTTTEEAHFDEQDNTNVVTWTDDGWPHDQYQAIALTTVTYSTNTGEIMGADIEVNTADYEFTNSDDNVVHDLRNTLTHEVGHFLGLDHSSNAEATMYATAREGETKKRDLHEADAAGVCHIYPDGYKTTSSPQRQDQQDDERSSRGCGCHSTNAASTSLFALVMLLLGVLMVRRRLPA